VDILAILTPFERHLNAIFGPEGFDEESWNYVKAHLKTWCDGNDLRHPQGWILLMMGAPSLAKLSIHSVGGYNANQCHCNAILTRMNAILTPF